VGEQHSWQQVLAREGENKDTVPTKEHTEGKQRKKVGTMKEKRKVGKINERRYW
jgi:hypothetical protein